MSRTTNPKPRPRESRNRPRRPADAPRRPRYRCADGGILGQAQALALASLSEADQRAIMRSLGLIEIDADEAAAIAERRAS